MMALEQARAYLEQLGLTQAAAVLDNRLDLAARQQLSYPEVLIIDEFGTGPTTEPRPPPSSP